MPKNLVFFGLHLVIGKLYTNSLLISLNTRKELHEMRWSYKSDWDPAMPVLTTDDFTVPYTRSYQYGAVMSLTMTSPTSAYRPVFKMTPEVLSPILEFNVERRVERRSDNINSIIQSDYTHSQRYHHPQSPRHMGNHLTSLP
ncbi:hypothetical protein B0H13DRAFT_2102743 [Mycena leptocephala]|nr:hypothetical protein B0H13DRAFT_2102743 [Mycena leptocephala]